MTIMGFTAASHPARRRGRTALAVLGVLALLPLTADAAGAQSGSTPNPNATRARREEIRRQRATQASQINVLQSSIAEATEALDALEANVRGQIADVEDARRAVEAAEAEVVRAEAAVVDAQDRLVGLDADLKRLAVLAYVRPSDDSLISVLESEDLSEATRVRALLGMRAGRVQSVRDEANRVREDLEIAEAAAEGAALEAEARRQEESQRLADLEAARAQQAELADGLEDRLDRSLAEAQMLADLDAQLSAQLQREQAELARRLAEAAARRRAAGGSNRGGGTRGVDVGNVTVTTVRGITVNVSIADNVAALVDAAAADGITLAGGGYRSSAGQIATRRSNCGTSDYAIWQMPASQCRPPTARPGRSMHERGLAVDFTCNGGGIIRSRSSPCFKWLKANASRYGLYNLPSEPWHWSTNGT